MDSTFDKKEIIQSFKEYVSSGKVAFFEKFGMDCVMGKREGVYLSDHEGRKKLINLHCNGGVFNLGHRNAEIIEALKSALDYWDIGNHLLLSEGRAALAQRIAELMPGDLKYSVFGVSGGEAVDLAIKVARGFTGRQKIISIKGGYHGHTGLALATGDEKYRSSFGSNLPGFVQIPFNDFEELKDCIDSDTAAFLIESVPATLGVVLPQPNYLSEIRKLCNQNGALFIIDEVQSGLGRTGKLWAFEHFNIIPDMVIIGKGLSGGIYPITATVLREPLESFFHKDPFVHISTFGGAEVGCWVALKLLEITTRIGFLDHVNKLSDEFGKKMKSLKQKHYPFFQDIRQLGLMIGLELEDRLSGPLFSKSAYENDLLMVYANNDTSIVQLFPPLIMDLSMVDEVIDRLDKSFEMAKKLKTSTF